MSDLRTALKALPKPDVRYCTLQWAEREAQIRQMMLTGDISQFLRWRPCRLALVKPKADVEFTYLRSLPNWETRWQHAVEESDVGKSPRYRYYRQSSGILLRHAALLAWLEEMTGRWIETFGRIFEFGGGYGSMCRLVHRLGFVGRYVIYDLPALTLLQQYYLEQNGIENVVSVCDFDVLPKLLYSENALFIATWSLSEAPFSIREEIFSLIRHFSSFIIAGQIQVREMDNVEYFYSWTERLPSVKWYRKRLREELWLVGARE